jgi:hypothetical protein
MAWASGDGQGDRKRLEKVAKLDGEIFSIY